MPVLSAMRVANASTLINRFGRTPDWPGRLDWLVLAAVVLFLCLAFNGNSLWIDEGYSAYIASQHHLSDMWRALRGSDSGDLQTLGYYLYLWSWAHLFGTTEAALRFSNLPLLVLLCLALQWTSREIFNSQFGWVLCVLCPFFWVYLNEARVYFMLAALGSAAVAACLASTNGQSERVRILGALACLFFVWVGTVADVLMLFLIPGLLFLVCAAGLGSFWATWHRALKWVLPLYVLEGAYIVWTLLQPQLMSYDKFRPLYIALFGYELAGLQGIGPSRNQLRLLAPNLDSGTFLQGDLLLPLLAGGLILGLFAALVVGKSKNRRWSIQLFIAGLISLGSLCLVSLILSERFLPRHAAGILPLFVFGLLALLSDSATATRLRMKIATVLVFGAVWIGSDLRLTFDSRYAKDDFRGAIARAVELAAIPGNRLVWVGDYFTPSYYGLRLEDWSKQLGPSIWPEALAENTGWKFRATGVYAPYFSEPQIRQLINQESQGVTYVAVTKLDLYDLKNSWRPYLSAHGERLSFPFSPFALYKVRPAQIGNEP